MPRMQVYLPEDLYAELKSRHLPASELLQEAVREEVHRLELLEGMDRYLDELAEEVGEPDRRAVAEAEELGRRLAAHRRALVPADVRVVLDSGAVTHLARRNQRSQAKLLLLQRQGYGPLVVPSVVLVEATSGRPGQDAPTNRLLQVVEVVERLPVATARRAAELRHRARRGSAVDAVVVAVAEPDGIVLTGDPVDLLALAAHSDGVAVEPI